MTAAGRRFDDNDLQQRLDRAIAAVDLADRRRVAARLAAAEGAAQLLHQDVEPLAGVSPIDPVPFCLDWRSWVRLAEALGQRVRLLDAIANDLYGEQRLLKTGIIPAEALYADPRFCRPCQSLRRDRPAVVLSSTTVAWRPGEPPGSEFVAVDDDLDGLDAAGQILLARSITSKVMPELVEAIVPAAHGVFIGHLRERLATMSSPIDGRSPRTVVLAESSDRGYLQHSYLAMLLGYSLVEPDDLVVRGGRTWLRSLGQLEPIDVVLRTIASSRLDPLELTGSGGGVPGLTMAVRAGQVVVANALGADVAISDVVTARLDRACSLLLNESLLLRSADGAAGIDNAAAIRTVTLNASVGPRTLPGGIVKQGGDRSVRDLWVVGAPVSEKLHTQWRPPQVDLRGSVPARAAESLFWLGRNAERSEAVARTVQSMATLMEVNDIFAADWIRRVATQIEVLARPSLPLAEPSTSSWNVLTSLGPALGACLAATVASARTARTFLSKTAWRVVGRIDRSRPTIEGVPAHNQIVVLTESIDELLVELAALSGACMESVVRGPSWVFLDLGRRIERALLTVRLVETLLGHAGEGSDPLEALLASCDSLIVYRRRYRSDLRDDSVVELVVRDTTNPRSVAFQLDRIREHHDALPTASVDDRELLDRAVEALEGVSSADLSGLAAVTDALHSYASRQSNRWFSHLDALETLRGLP